MHTHIYIYLHIPWDVTPPPSPVTLKTGAGGADSEASHSALMVVGMVDVYGGSKSAAGVGLGASAGMYGVRIYV